MFDALIDFDVDLAAFVASGEPNNGVYVWRRSPCFLREEVT